MSACGRSRVVGAARCLAGGLASDLPLGGGVTPTVDIPPTAAAPPRCLGRPASRPELTAHSALAAALSLSQVPTETARASARASRTRAGTTASALRSRAAR